MSEEQLKDTTAMPVAGKPPANVQVTWSGDHVFEGVRSSGGPAITMDSSGKQGPSPVDTLLCALAGCTGVDLVDILTKRRTPMSALSVDVVGERFSGTPSRITKIHLVYHIIGAGVERVHAERAIELAVTKYCSVRDSLDPNLPITWALELNGSYE
ncbi:OsmC family protein [Gemmatimonas sp.]|uniref:OsmC family protein n=1 Tax=Gemmatimonas sp. TaxID=1962908 RepID=UPI00286B44DF|nr:OsmC family protein [Gemmatimonas sp.]